MAIRLGQALLQKLKGASFENSEQIARLQSLLGKWLAWNRHVLPCVHDEKPTFRRSLCFTFIPQWAVQLFMRITSYSAVCAVRQGA